VTLIFLARTELGIRSETLRLDSLNRNSIRKNAIARPAMATPNHRNTATKAVIFADEGRKALFVGSGDFLQAGKLEH
jgi:hypothetical protein